MNKKLEQSILFCANSIADIINENSYKSIALSSSLKLAEKDILIIDAVIEKLSEMGLSVNYEKYLVKDSHSESKINIFLINSISEDFNALQIARKCGCLILFEKYAYTRHKKFDELKYTVSQNKINLVGVIPIK